MSPVKFILSFLAFCLQAAGQTTIRIVIKDPGGHKIDKVDAFDQSQYETYRYAYKDTLVLKFKKKNIDCYNIRYHEGSNMFRKQIWLDTGYIKIEAHIAGNNLIIDTVINSPFYYETFRFYDRYAQFSAPSDTTALNDFLLASFEKNIGNPYSILIGHLYVLHNQNSRAHLIKLKSLLDKQGDRFSWYLLYPSVTERVTKAMSIDKIDLSGYSFSDIKNKASQLHLTGFEYYVLDFWFLACPPCIKQHAEIKKELSDLNKKGVQVIGISTDSEAKKWKDYLTKHDYVWPNYREGKKNSISTDLSLASYPTYLVLNSKGDIINTYISFSDVLKRFGIDRQNPR